MPDVGSDSQRYASDVVSSAVPAIEKDEGGSKISKRIRRI